MDALAVLNGGPIVDTADAEQVFNTFRKRIEAKTQDKYAKGQFKSAPYLRRVVVAATDLN
jgi:hypothetical protein